MAEHPNATRVMRGLQARARGKFDEADMAILNDVFADDVTWHSTGRGAIQQDVHGKEAVLGAWRSVAEQSGDSFRLEPGTIYGDDLHVVGSLAPIAPVVGCIVIKPDGTRTLAQVITDPLASE